MPLMNCFRTMIASRPAYSTDTLSAARSSSTRGPSSPRHTAANVSRVGILAIRDTGRPSGSTNRGHTATTSLSVSKCPASFITVSGATSTCGDRYSSQSPFAVRAPMFIALVAPKLCGKRSMMIAGNSLSSCGLSSWLPQSTSKISKRPRSLDFSRASMDRRRAPARLYATRMTDTLGCNGSSTGRMSPMIREDKMISYTRRTLLQHGDLGSGLPVDFLQAPHPDRIAPARGDGFDGSPGAAHGCNARYTIGQCVAPDRLFIAERVGFACRRIDGQIERARSEEHTSELQSRLHL